MKAPPFVFVVSLLANVCVVAIWSQVKAADPIEKPPIALDAPKKSTPNPPSKFPSDLDVGRELDRVGDHEGAIAAYEKALTSEDPALRSTARDLLEAAIQKKKKRDDKEDQSRGYVHLGGAWERQGKIDEAIGAYEKALGSKSEAVRHHAARKLSALIKQKTTRSRQYFTTPFAALLMTLWKPFFVGLCIFALIVLARWCIHRSDLLLIPNPTIPDIQGLEILIQDYDRQAKEIQGFPSRKSAMGFITFGSAGELFADFISRITTVDSGLWRQRLVRFLQKPQFELQLSLPSNSSGGIVIAKLSKGKKIRRYFIKEFSTSEFSTLQKELAFWIAYQIRQSF